MTNINNGTAFDDASDRFGMRLRYQDAGLPANRRCYNGNIAQINWKVAGAGLPNTNAQTYDYSYDGLSRLTSAAYTAPGKDHHFNANFDYDLNGNILALQRWMNSTLTDDLDYVYERATSFRESRTMHSTLPASMTGIRPGMITFMTGMEVWLKTGIK